MLGRAFPLLDGTSCLPFCRWQTGAIESPSIQPVEWLKVEALGGKGAIKRVASFMVFRYTQQQGGLNIAIVLGGYNFLREIKSRKEHLWSL